MKRAVVGLVALLIVGAGQSRAGEKEAEKLFGLAKVHAAHLEMTAAQWRKMQPPMKFPGFPFRPGGKGEPAEDVHKSAGAFGTEFPWAQADFTIGDQTIKNVGVRFKGNFTYVASAQILRRSMKVEFDHYDEDAPRAFGQRKLNLSNGITDLARVRETLAFSVYRAAKVPAPRTAYVELTLSVPGRYDRELVGVYTIIEQIDKSFLKAHFKNGKGLLLKPENLKGGIEYLGENWPAYEAKYRPKNDGSRADRQRLVEFARLIHKAPDEEFAREVGKYLDIEEFLRFIAADAIMANLDSYLGYGHNFYLYLRPDTNQFVFMPWDVDLSMGMWPVGGPPEAQMNLSLEHPHIGQNRLIDRLFAIKDVKEQYRGALREIARTSFSNDKLQKELDELEAALKAPLAREKRASEARGESVKGSPFAKVVAPGPGMRTFIARRTDSIRAQLEGGRRGYVPAGMPFAGPGGFGPPGRFGPGFKGPNIVPPKKSASGGGFYSISP